MASLDEFDLSAEDEAFLYKYLEAHDHKGSESFTCTDGDNITHDETSPRSPKNLEAKSLADKSQTEQQKVDVYGRNPTLNMPKPEFADESTKSPLYRFRTYPKKSFSVSDLTAGAWCELQYLYTLERLPGGRRTTTKEMEGGTSIHQKLEDEVHDTVPIEVSTVEDVIGIRIWNLITGLRSLQSEDFTRELSVWGEVDGLMVTGVIDQVSLEHPMKEELQRDNPVEAHIDPQLVEIAKEFTRNQTEQLNSHGVKTPGDTQSSTPIPRKRGRPRKQRVYHITDVKTRGGAKMPAKTALRPTTIQLYLYHRCLTQMICDRLDYGKLYRRMGANPDKSFSDVFLAATCEIYDDQRPESSRTRNESNSDDNRENGHAMTALPYQTLRELTELLRRELKKTFAQGRSSLSDELCVEYRNRVDGGVIGRKRIVMDDNQLDAYLAKDLQWWRGERQPRGPRKEEAPSKCRVCEFAADCDWRINLEEEAIAQSKAKSLLKMPI